MRLASRLRRASAMMAGQARQNQCQHGTHRGDSQYGRPATGTHQNQRHLADEYTCTHVRKSRHSHHRQTKQPVLHQEPRIHGRPDSDQRRPVWLHLHGKLQYNRRKPGTPTPTDSLPVRASAAALPRFDAKRLPVRRMVHRQHRYDFSTPVTENITLTARWTSKTPEPRGPSTPTRATSSATKPPPSPRQTAAAALNSTKSAIQLDPARCTIVFHWLWAATDTYTPGETTPMDSSATAPAAASTVRILFLGACATRTIPMIQAKI